MPAGQPAPEFRHPTIITDLAEFAPDYIKFMRASGTSGAADVLVDYAFRFFRDVPSTPQQIRTFSLMVVDRIYLHAATLTEKGPEDGHYFGVVTRYLLDIMRSRGTKVFYILDNQMRLDRFHIAVEFLIAAGIAVVTPYTTGDTPLAVGDVLHQIEIEMSADRHVAYIEMDASVNYLREVAGKGQESGHLVWYRNRPPDDHQVEHVPSRGVPSVT